MWFEAALKATDCLRVLRACLAVELKEMTP